MQQQARLVSLPPLPTTLASSVRVVGDQVVLDHVVVGDATAAAYLGSRPEEERAPLVERALRIGLLALQDAGVQVNVDVVRREFEALLSRTQQVNERAAATLDTVLRDNFADGEGRLPRTLERFLGNRGALQSFVEELFDEERRDSAIGRLRVLLGTYFDGDASRLAQLLDPTRLGSPLHQFRVEVAEGFVKLNDRLTAMESAAATRASERQKQALKGADFEEIVADACGQAVRGFGDLLDRTGSEMGDVARSKKGDLVLTLDPSASRGQELRVVIECKDRSISGREMREELAEAKRNRTACVALVVFTPQHAPAGIAPFDVRGGDVYCVLDPAAPDLATMEASVRLARLLALATLREHTSGIDADGIARALVAVREQLDQIRSLKTRLTSIGQLSVEVTRGLDTMRTGVLAKVAEAEAVLAAAGTRLAEQVRS